MSCQHVPSWRHRRTLGVFCMSTSIPPLRCDFLGATGAAGAGSSTNTRTCQNLPRARQNLRLPSGSTSPRSGNCCFMRLLCFGRYCNQHQSATTHYVALWYTCASQVKCELCRLVIAKSSAPCSFFETDCCCSQHDSGYMQINVENENQIESIYLLRFVESLKDCLQVDAGMHWANVPQRIRTSEGHTELHNCQGNSKHKSSCGPSHVFSITDNSGLCRSPNKIILQVSPCHRLICFVDMLHHLLDFQKGLSSIQQDLLHMNQQERCTCNAQGDRQQALKIHFFILAGDAKHCIYWNLNMDLQSSVKKAKCDHFQEASGQSISGVDFKWLIHLSQGISGLLCWFQRTALTGWALVLQTWCESFENMKGLLSRVRWALLID